MKLDKTEVLNPNPDKGMVNEKMNAEKKEMGGPPSDKRGAENIKQKGEPFSFQVDEGWAVYSNMRGKGGSERANKDRTPSSAAGKLGQAGTPVAASKPSLPFNSWNSALTPNTKASVFGEINEARSANLQDYLGQEKFILANFGGKHRYSMWITATVQIALVQAI